MCGIAGQWGLSSESIHQALPRALKKLQHRGPDDSGHELFVVNNSVIGLGHTRLSIIDLSSAGHQPMHGADGRYAIVFNGEIYNYRELREELKLFGHQFRSDSDTEVLLAAWAQWNTDCLSRLVGMFAFVVLDKHAKTMTCARDAFGIKPFFYKLNKADFSFASELPALLELLPNKPQLNWQRAYDYLVHGDYDSNEQTFFEDVHHLAAGHYLTIDLSSVAFNKPTAWWIPEIKESPDWSYERATEAVREQFLKNIRMHLRADVPLGAALSGGIDSSAVVCAMRYVEPNLPIHTFSYIASGTDVNEEQWVDRVNAHVGAITHKVSLGPKDLAHDLDDMIRVQGEPFGSTSIYAQYRVFQLAKESGVTVTLDGQGADEMLAGYSGYPGQRLRSLIEVGDWSGAWEFFNHWSVWPGRNWLEALKRLLAENSAEFLYSGFRFLNGDRLVPSWINEDSLRRNGVKCHYPKKTFNHGNGKGRRVIEKLSCSLTKDGVISLLRHGDRNSMRFSVESRVPFLTIDMVNLLLSMPENYLISNQGETKHVFRAAMRGIVPDDVLDRKDKIGFATPEKDWLMSMAPTVRCWLKDDISLSFLNQTKVLEEFDQIVAGQKPFSWHVWRWVNFCRWYKHFML
jgi:asparagine synthase (glutamine-hydrolysing)